MELKTGMICVGCEPDESQGRRYPFGAVVWAGCKRGHSAPPAPGSTCRILWALGKTEGENGFVAGYQRVKDQGGVSLRLGILGGTFDPIHYGHLRLAEETAEALGLEKIILLPAALPPHKDRKPITTFFHRLQMTRIAAQASPLLEVQDLEGRREGLSYSIETLREFHRQFSPGLELFFVLGMDAFLEVRTWKEYDRLFDYAHFVVIKRPGVPSESLESFLSSLGLGFRKEDHGDDFVAPSGFRLIYREATLLDISSTAIRRKVADGRSIRFLVPEGVLMYIRQNGLYRTHGDA